MADEPTVGEIRRRLERAEREIQQIRDSYPTEVLVDERLARVAGEIAVVRGDVTRVETRIESVRGEAVQRRLLVYGAMVTAVVSLVVALILGGGLQMGG